MPTLIRLSRHYQVCPPQPGRIPGLRRPLVEAGRACPQRGPRRGLQRLGWVAAGLGVVVCSLSVLGAEREALRQTSAAFVDIAERSMPAVVSIRVTKTVTVGGEQGALNNPLEFFGEDFLRRFFPGLSPGQGSSPRQREFIQQGSGSGFLVSKDGYILSNNHVVGDADEITVRLNDGREFEAQRIGTDPKSEVALIKIEGNDFPVLPLGDSGASRVGEWVIAIGNPFGLAQTLTVGVVSATGRSNIGITDYEDFIQTDAAINPGNSGGPLLNARGEAIGINTAIFSRSGGYMGIGFAIPINMATYVKTQLIEQGEVIRGYLGVYIQPVTRELAEAFGLEEAKGILVSQVTDGSGADEAGLRAGDIILELNGEPVENAGDFRNTVSANPPGTEVRLTVFRDGDAKELGVTTGEFPQAEEVEQATTQQESEPLGLGVRNLTADLAQRFGYETEDGVIVAQVAYGSPAAVAGVRPGNLIASVNRTPVANVSEFRRAVADAKETGRVLLHVRDRRGSRFVVVEMD